MNNDATSMLLYDRFISALVDLCIRCLQEKCPVPNYKTLALASVKRNQIY